MTNEYEQRKGLTFEQAEGAEPLPSQLALRELSPEFRARLWHVLFEFTKIHSAGYDVYGAWKEVLYRHHVRREHRAADEFDPGLSVIVAKLKHIVFSGSYLDIFGFLQWILRAGPSIGLRQHIEFLLKDCRTAYALFEGDTIIPVGSEAETETLKRAFADVGSSEFHGARAHLRAAGSRLTAGQYPDSIRESIHAVEAVARVLDPSANTLAPALTKLEGSLRIHGALRAGFNSLYGFTSDEKGIRHALLELPAAQVDETDALYMLGSCAAFVSYLINKARIAGLLNPASP